MKGLKELGVIVLAIVIGLLIIYAATSLIDDQWGTPSAISVEKVKE